MIDVYLRTTDGREVILRRYTQPEKDLQIILDRMNWQFPQQPPPKIKAAALSAN